MGKKLSTRQFAVLKRTAQNTYPQVARKEKIEKQIEALKEELVILDAQIQGAETGSRALTGGFNSLDLIERVVIPTGKMDKEGREIKMTKFMPKESAIRQEEDGSYTIIADEEVNTPEGPSCDAEPVDKQENNGSAE